MNSVEASPHGDESCDLGIINQMEETPFKNYNYVQKSLVHSRFWKYPNIEITCLLLFIPLSRYLLPSRRKMPLISWFYKEYQCFPNSRVRVTSSSQRVRMIFPRHCILESSRQRWYRKASEKVLNHCGPVSDIQLDSHELLNEELHQQYLKNRNSSW